jgi:putative glutamine amidotransferase
MIEAIRHRGPGYVAGVQWHPEFHDNASQRLLDSGAIIGEFLQHCRLRRERPAARRQVTTTSRGPR